VTGSIVTCPHCRGEGHREEYGICGLCSVPSYGQGRLIRGWLELPLTPAQAEFIYGSTARPEVEALVNCEAPDEGATTCLDCTPERTCYGCWAFGAGPDDGALSW
jgi:hypothetical protein